MSNRVNVDQLLTDFHAAAQTAGFTVKSYATVFAYPLLVATRRAGDRAKAPKKVYLSSGIHGDEPAPPLALIDLLNRDALPHAHDYMLFPCMNPSGLAAGTRENPHGIDLNRDFSDFQSDEIRAHRNWLDAHCSSLDLAIHLHEDWEATGAYFYELNFNGHRSRADAILAAATKYLPIETATRIDGHRARNGVIRTRSLPQVTEGNPEAISLQKRYQALNYTIETPSALPISRRVAALSASALAAIHEPMERPH